MARTPDLQTLRCFVTVAREGNVSRAARLLHITQPAVSLQLKRLGRDVGVKLFDRTAKGLELTRDGRSLLVKAEQVLASLEDFSQAARRLTGKIRGTLRIGTIVDPDFTRLGQFLKALVEAAPELETELVHGMSGQVPERILRNEIDAGFYLGELAPEIAGSHPKHKGAIVFVTRHLTQFKYCVIAPAGWERRVHGMGWAQLANLPWIGTPTASVHHRLLTRLFLEHGVTQNHVALVDQELSTLAMVKSGVGLSLCRESIALHEMQTNGLVVADLADITTSLTFITLAARQADPAIACALSVLSNVWSGSINPPTNMRPPAEHVGRTKPR